MRDRDYLEHIKKAIDEVREIVQGLDRDAYGADIKAQRAVERELQIIGDAVHKLSDDLVRTPRCRVAQDLCRPERRRALPMLAGQAADAALAT